MYQSIKFVALFVIVFVVFTSATSAQDKTLESKQKNDGAINIIFDKDKNQTTAELNELLILENESKSLSMSVLYKFSGRKPNASDSLTFFVLSVASKQICHQFKPHTSYIVVTVDEQIIQTRDMENHTSYNKDNRIIEPFFTAMPFKVLAKMAEAKKVTFKFKDVEYELTTKNLKTIQEFVGRIVP